MIRTAIVILCCVLGFGAALRSRFGALLFYMWIAFFRPQEWVWTDIEFLRLSLVSGLLVIVPSLATFRFPDITHKLTFVPFLCVASAGIAYNFAVEPSSSLYWLNFILTLSLISSYIVTLTDTFDRFLLLIGMITGSFAFYSAKAGLLSLVSGGARFGSGIAGAFSDNNAYAIGGVMMIYPLIFVAQNTRRRWLRYGAWLAVPLTALTVISTFSRAGFLSLVVSALVFMLLQRNRVKLLFMSVLAIPVALLVVPIPEGYFDRIQTIRTYEEVDETSALSRLYFWQVALKMAADHPLGLGPWQFEANYDAYDDLGIYGRRRSVHNSFLQALTEIGWVGGAAFAGLFAIGWRVLFRIRSSAMAADSTLPRERLHFTITSSNALIASLVAFAVGGNFIAMAYNDLTWLTFGIIAALDRIVTHAQRSGAAAPQNGARVQAPRPVWQP